MPDWGLSGDGQLANTYGLTTATTTGTSVPTHSNPNRWKDWIELTNVNGTPLAAGLPFHGTGLIFTAYEANSATDYIVDLGVGATLLTVTPIVSKLYFNFSAAPSKGGQQVYLPLETLAGTRIWARMASSVGATTLICSITQTTSTFRPARTFTKCVTYNMTTTVLDPPADTLPADPTSCVPVTFVDPGATVTGVKSFLAVTPGGAAATISSIVSPATSTVQYPISVAIFCFAPGISANTQPTARWYIDIRRATATSIIVPDLAVAQEANADHIAQPYFGPVPLSIRAGETIDVGACISIATDGATVTATNRRVGVIMYAFS